jgi:predicted DNA-binding transcriptional regulator AlpA
MASGLEPNGKAPGLPVKVTVQDKDKGEALLAVPELAERIGVQPGWVYHAVKFEGMPCIRLNSRFWRFHWPTVLAWLQKRQ